MRARLLLAVILAWSGLGYAGIEIPKVLPRELVADYAAQLSPPERNALGQKLHEYYNKTSNVFVIVTIPSLEAVNQPSLQEWNMHLAETWKPGDAKKDNGLILTVLGTRAPYKVRINPGRGLEGALPDAYLKRLIEDRMKPVLNQPGQFSAGISLAVEDMAARVGSEFLPEKKDYDPTLAFGIIFLIFALALFAGLFIVLMMRTRGISEEPRSRGRYRKVYEHDSRAWDRTVLRGNAPAKIRQTSTSSSGYSPGRSRSSSETYVPVVTTSSWDSSSSASMSDSFGSVSTGGIAHASA